MFYRELIDAIYTATYRRPTSTYKLAASRTGFKAAPEEERRPCIGRVSRARKKNALG